MGLLTRKSKVGTPGREVGLGISRKYNLSPGRTYVIEEAPPNISFDAFVNILSTASEEGKKAVGIAISRQHPDIIRQKYGLEATPILWLAARGGGDGISPPHPPLLSHTT